MRRVAVALRAAAPRLLAVVATTLLTRMIGVIMTAAGIDPAALMIGAYLFVRLKMTPNDCGQG